MENILKQRRNIARLSSVVSHSSSVSVGVDEQLCHTNQELFNVSLPRSKFSAAVIKPVF